MTRLEVFVDFQDYPFAFLDHQDTAIREGVLQVLDQAGNTYTFPLSQISYTVLEEEQ